MKKKEYKKLFPKRKAKKALKRAWLNRDFEIEMYWKRASYFWTFIAAAFIGYITLISSSGYKENLRNEFPQIEYVIICLGFIFSISWLLVNIGSKRWQRNWENHIDNLENDITGPIYKVVNKELSYSVSKINKFISGFVAIIWIILGLKYSFVNIKFCCANCKFDWMWTLMTILTIGLALLLILKIGKTNGHTKEIEFIRRKVKIKQKHKR